MDAVTIMEKITKAKAKYDAMVAYAEKTFKEAVAAAYADETTSETTSTATDTEETKNE